MASWRCDGLREERGDAVGEGTVGIAKSLLIFPPASGCISGSLCASPDVCSPPGTVAFHARYVLAKTVDASHGEVIVHLGVG